MAKVKVDIGRVPQSRGEYVEGKAYKKDNIVTRYGSAFQCVVDSTTTPPATLDASGKVTLGEGWIFFADTSAISNAVAEHTEKITNIEQLLQEGYTFMGVATPETNPGTPDQKVFYIANGKGAYANFGGLIVDEDEVVLLIFDDTWKKSLSGIAAIKDLEDFKDGFSSNGNNIFNPNTQLDKENYYASLVDGHINYTPESGYKAFCIPVNGEKIVTFSKKMRFIVPTLEDKYTSTAAELIQNTNSIDLAQYTKTRYLFISFNDTTEVSKDLKVYYGSSYKDGLVLPEWTKEIELSSLKGKVTAKMMDGYQTGNLFPDAELYADGYYVNLSDGHIDKTADAVFNSYIMPVDGVSKYTFTFARFVLPLADDKYTVLSQSLIRNVTTIDCSDYEGLKYIAFSFNKEIYPINKYIVSRGGTLQTNDIYPDWINAAIDERITIDKKIPYLSAERALLNSGQSLIIPSSRTNLRKGMRVIICTKITSGTNFEFGFTTRDSVVVSNHNTIVVTSDQAKFAKEVYTYQKVENHGLTIGGMTVVIFEYKDNGTAKYTILANGKSFEHTIGFVLQTVSAPYLMSNGAVMEDSKITLSCTDIDKKIWFFGDSYFSYSPERWTYYLQQYGYAKNILLDGFPGEGGVNGRVSFATLLKMGTPKYAVWCLGMNDGSDPNDTTPSTNWVDARDVFINLCVNNGVTPVFATIPNVPTINHKGKNAWIRASGYRFIDLCHAVGADDDNNWLGGMLSGDKVHPSEDGAKALFGRVLIDLPEIMIE